MTRKSVAPDDLRLLVDASQKKTASLRRCTPKKRSGQVAFGFWSMPHEKPCQPSEICPEKTLRSDCLRLLINPLQKASPAFRNVPRKNVHIRRPSALGRYPTKSPTSLRNCALKRRSGQAASGFWSIPHEKPLQRSEMCLEKTLRSDSLRLLVDTLQKAPPAFGDVSPKNVPARGPPAFGQFPAKSPVSLRRYTPEKRSRQIAFGFWSIPCKKSRQPSEMSSGNTFTSGSLWLWVDPLRKTTQVACCDNSKKCNSR